MFAKIEDFFLNKFAGKLISRGGVIVAGYLTGRAAAVHITLNPDEVIGAFTLVANWLFEWFKARRMKNPASPAIQTDVTKLPGMGV